MVEKVWKDVGGNQAKTIPAERFGRYKTEVEEKIERRERLSLRNKVKQEKHLWIYGGLTEGIGTKTHLHDPMDSAKPLKLRFCVGDLDLPERRNSYTTVVAGGESRCADVPVWQSNRE